MAKKKSTATERKPMKKAAAKAASRRPAKKKAAKRTSRAQASGGAMKKKAAPRKKASVRKAAPRKKAVMKKRAVKKAARKAPATRRAALKRPAQRRKAAPQRAARPERPMGPASTPNWPNALKGTERGPGTVVEAQGDAPQERPRDPVRSFMRQVQAPKPNELHPGQTAENGPSNDRPGSQIERVKHLYPNGNRPNSGSARSTGAKGKRRDNNAQGGE